MSFAHLHVHSHFSLLDGILKHDEMAAFTEQNNMPAIALTDHGNLFGIVDFISACDNHNVKGIVGCELYMTSGSRFNKTREDGMHHLTALAMNNEGYHNLIKLVSYAFIEGFYYKPRVDMDLLERYHKGVVFLSGCPQGLIPSLLSAERTEDALKAARGFQDLFGKENFYIELMDHGLEEELRLLPRLIQFARQNDFPMVATNDAHYLKPDDAKLQDILLCISTGKKLQDENRLRFSGDTFYLKTEEEMRKLFRETPEALDSTAEIAERAHFHRIPNRTYLPHFTVPEGFSSVNHYFEHRCQEGLRHRLDSPRKRRHGEEAYRERLQYELDTIRDMNFPGYFLIVSDIIQYALDHGISVGPGRGSAAGSLVAYALNITDVDPLEYSLLFERFLNRNRISLPDIDVDFAHTGRGKILDYIRQKYGEKNVSQIVTFNTLKAKSAIQDVARVLGFEYQEILMVTKALPYDLTIRESLKNNETFKKMVDGSPSLKEVVSYASRLEGLVRNISVHAAGVVITPEEVVHYVPLSKTPKEETVTQFDKDRLEELGLLKMDILGLRTLTVIHDTIRGIENRLSDRVDLATIPLDDKDVYRLFSRGETDGVFQFESEGMKKILRQTQPDRFEDLVALNALYRPGAIQSNMVDEFIQRKQGKKPVKHLTPELETLLSETYGIIVYQEQVMQVAVQLAGYSTSDADKLRKAMGKKKPEIMEAEKEKFVQGFVKNGKSKKLGEAIFEFIEPFAGYGFNKSHSVAYARLAYQTAYLKCHYPRFYMAALLTSEINDSKKVSQYISECSRMGIDLLPPDINESEREFSVVQQSIRFGLEAIKGVGSAAAEDIVAIRKTSGHFKNLTDFISSLSSQSVNKKTLESLIFSGAFDSLEPNRAFHHYHLETYMNIAARHREDRLSGQKSLFGDKAMVLEEPDLSDVSPWPRHHQLLHEFESTGIYISGHPLDEYRDLLKQLSDVEIKDLNTQESKQVQVGGMILDLQTLQVKAGTNAGKTYARFNLEDLSGSVSCVVFADTFKSIEQKLHNMSDEPMIIKGLVKVEGGKSSLLVSDMYPIGEARTRQARELVIRLVDSMETDRLEEVRNLMIKHRGSIPVKFVFQKSGQFTATIRPDYHFRIDLSDSLLEQLEQMTGKGSCHIIL